MTKEFLTLLQINFLFFAMKAFAAMNSPREMPSGPYLTLLATKLARFASRDIQRLIINLPPRHFKTWLGTICTSAWILAHNPSAKILILTYGQELADKIAYAIRAILQTEWYRRAFRKTKLAKNRSKLMDFATTAGGGVRSLSIQGGVTGLGADYIIIDDPVEIKDCDNTKWLTHVNELFDNEIITRLDNPKKGGVAVLAHRLHEDDLPGHLLSQSGWTLLKLPLIAPRARTYHLGNGEIWERQKGELLMPEAFTSRDIEQRRAAKRPGFETLQQQNPTAKTSVRIQATDFASFSSDMPTFDAAIVLSVDPGQKAGANHSFCVIQAWAARKRIHHLVDQWRAHATYLDARSAVRKFIGRHRPSVVLIEETGHGPALLSEIRPQEGMRLFGIVPVDEKLERLRRHLPLIRGHRVAIPSSSLWREDFLAELTEFPHGHFDDQVDALTQYLDWSTQNPPPPKRPNRPSIVGMGLAEGLCRRRGVIKGLCRRAAASRFFLGRGGSGEHRPALAWLPRAIGEATGHQDKDEKAPGEADEVSPDHRQVPPAAFVPGIDEMSAVRAGGQQCSCRQFAAEEIVDDTTRFMNQSSPIIE